MQVHAGFRGFLRDLLRDDRGMETLEVALGIALFAAIAGFGFFALGNSLANYFAAMGQQFAAPPQTPN